MSKEIQNREESIIRFSASDMKKLDLENLQQEAFLAVRKEFIQRKNCLSLLRYYEDIWCKRIQKVFYSVVIENKIPPLCIKIVSSQRYFFLFPRDITRDINKGWISLVLKDREQLDLFFSCLNGSFKKSLEKEIHSWFFSIWDSMDSYSFLPPDRVQLISSSSIYLEWLKGQNSCFYTRLLFRLYVFRFFKRTGLRKKKSGIHRISLKTRYDFLYFRCLFQRRIRILKENLRSFGFSEVKFLSWKNYKIPIFILALIFSGLTMNHYRHSLKLIKSHSESETAVQSFEQADPFINVNQREFRMGGCLHFSSLVKIERIHQYEYSTDKLQGIFWKEKDFNGRLVLTFDDGPNLDLMDWGNSQTSITSAILDTLYSRGLTAVFFINGKNLESRSPGGEQEIKDLLSRMIREGHMIGNHSYHHYNLARGVFIDGKQDYQETKREFDATQEQLDRILGYHYPLILIRPPYAEPGRTDVLDQILKDEKQYLISLQFDSYDYAYTEGGFWQRDKLLAHVKKLVLPAQGGVLLMHDHENSVYLLEDILDDQEIRSCTEIVDLSEIMFDKYGKTSEEIDE